MSRSSEIRTERLLLRRFQASDAESLNALADAFEIADTMISIPHPLPPGFARIWIEPGPYSRFALCEAESGALAGSLELRAIDAEHAQAELSFWIGLTYWGRGYATEAGAALVRHAFGALGLNRVYAFHMLRNPASGRVLARLGMRQEGLLRERVRKWDRFEDVAIWSVLRRDLGATPLREPA